MSNNINFTVLLIVVLVVVTDCWKEEREKRALGSPQDADLNDSQTQQALETGKSALSIKYHLCNEALYVTKATSQVAKGNVYTFDFGIDYSPCEVGGSLVKCCVTVSSFAGNYTVLDPICSN
ncbi:hypothetical protein CHUAL_003719 [Chamberlinius hualienensis]